MATTLRDIAQKTHLSLATVAKVLGKESARFKPETRRRVLRVAEELGYRPFRSAIAMRSGRTDTLCLLQSVEAHRSMVMGGVLEGIQDVVREERLHLSLAQLPDEKLAHRGFVPRILTELACDGLLVNYNTQVPQAMIDLIDRFQTPAIWLNIKRPCNCVFPDDLLAGELAAQHLFKQGFEDVAFVDLSNGLDTLPQDCHYSAIDRYNGVMKVARNRGRSVARISGKTTIPQPQRMQFLCNWLREHPRPVGIVAYAAWEARAVATACLATGRHIGREVGLVAIHEAPLHDLGFAIDTVVLPERQMGRMAARMLIDRLRQPKDNQPAAMLAPMLVEAAGAEPSSGTERTTP